MSCHNSKTLSYFCLHCYFKQLYKNDYNSISVFPTKDISSMSLLTCPSLNSQIVTQKQCILPQSNIKYALVSHIKPGCLERIRALDITMIYWLWRQLIYEKKKKTILIPILLLQSGHCWLWACLYCLGLSHTHDCTYETGLRLHSTSYSSTPLYQKRSHSGCYTGRQTLGWKV